MTWHDGHSRLSARKHANVALVFLSDHIFKNNTFELRRIKASGVVVVTVTSSVIAETCEQTRIRIGWTDTESKGNGRNDCWHGNRRDRKYPPQSSREGLGFESTDG